MKYKFKKSFCVVLVAVIAMCSAPLSGFVGLEIPELNLFFNKAEAAGTLSGTCGNNVTWTLKLSGGSLEISGTGAMNNYSVYWADPIPTPWESYNSYIKTVTINDGVTSVGKCAFYGCSNLNTVSIANSVKTIGEGSFGTCTSLETFSVPYGVTTIYAGAFENCSKLKTVEIPGSVLAIDKNAFMYCTALKNIVISNGVKYIYDNAFFECSSLENISIPASVQTIDSSVFTNCFELKHISVDTNNPYYSCDEYGALFNKNKTKLISYPAGNKKTEYTIPDTVTVIGKYAFRDNRSLTSIKIPDGITSVESSAFWNCSSLKKIDIPLGIDKLNSGIFCGCKSLTEIIIPDNIKSIGSSAFSGCINIETITIPENVKSIGSYAFEYCYKLTSVIFSEGVQSIDSKAFYNCKVLENVHIPSSVTSIGNDIFLSAPYAYICSATADTYGKAYADANNIDFKLCNGHGTVQFFSGYCGDDITWTLDTFAKKLVIEGTGDMWDWSSETKVPWNLYSPYISTVEIKNGITGIGDCAFAFCSNLTDVSIPDSVKTIGKSAFEETAITEITIPEGTTSIGYRAFYNCASLKNLEISDTVNLIGDYAFCNCKALESVKIGNGVNTIGYYAFGSCIKIKDVNYIGTQEEWAKINVDSGNGNLLYADIHFNPEKLSGYCGENLTYFLDFSNGKMTISGTGDMYDWDADKTPAPWNFYRSDILTVIIEDGVTGIGANAFRDSSNLSNVLIGNDVERIAETSFIKCPELKSFNVDTDNNFYSSDIHGVLMSKDGTVLIQHPAASESTIYVVPDGVTKINDYAFDFCKNLKNIHIPESVTDIGAEIMNGCYASFCSKTENCYAKLYAFENGIELTLCVGHNSSDIITSGQCGDNLTYLFNTTTGEFVINGTGEMWSVLKNNEIIYGVKSVQIGSGVTKIIFHSFVNETEIKSITIGNTVVEDVAQTVIVNRSFIQCSSLETLIIGNGVKSIEEHVFATLKNLSEISFGTGLETIGTSAFSECDSLTNLKLPDGLKSIGAKAFKGCDSLKSCVLSDGLKSIGAYAFSDCYQLEFIHIPESVTEISEKFMNDRFYICSESEGCYAKKFAEEHNFKFKICVGHDSSHEIISGKCGDEITYQIDLTSGLMVVDGTGEMWNWEYHSLPEWHKYRTDIKTLIIRNGVVSIGDFAFHDLTLTEINIPDGVVSIGKEAFSSSFGLKNINFSEKSNLNHIGDCAFIFCYSLENMKIPDGVMNIGNRVFSNCYSLESVDIPASVTNIGDDIFAICENLSDIYYDGTEKEWNDLYHGNLTDDVKMHFSHFYVTWTVYEQEYVYKQKVGEKIVPVSDVTPKTGYSFDGWDKPIPDTMPDRNITFTALWKPNIYIVTWNYPGNPVSFEVEYGSEIKVPENPEEEGWTFMNWIPQIPETMPAHDITFSAVWKINEYTVTWDVDGKTTASTVSYSSKIPMPEKPEKTGYTFIGWSPEIPETMPAENITFKAKWQINTYSLIYNIDGKKTEVLYDYGANVSKPSVPKKEGYKFIGWTPSIPTTMPAYDIEVFAVYEKTYICPDCGGEFIGEEAINNHIKEEESSKIKSTIIIKNNSGSKTINYGETLKLTAIVTDKPEGARILWFVDGVQKGEGDVFDVRFESGSKIITVKLADENGEVYQDENGIEITDSENVTVKSSLWQKIVSFFKNLFGADRTVVQAIFSHRV